jgi:hypothetical protein
LVPEAWAVEKQVMIAKTNAKTRVLLNVLFILMTIPFRCAEGTKGMKPSACNVASNYLFELSWGSRHTTEHVEASIALLWKDGLLQSFDGVQSLSEVYPCQGQLCN